MRALICLVSVAIASVVVAGGRVERDNPLGACHCDDELWIAGDCKTGYICDGQGRIYFISRFLCFILNFVTSFQVRYLKGTSPWSRDLFDLCM